MLEVVLKDREKSRIDSMRDSWSEKRYLKCDRRETKEMRWMVPTIPRIIWNKEVNSAHFRAVSLLRQCSAETDSLPCGSNERGGDAVGIQ